MSEMTDLFGSLDIGDLDEIAGKLNVSQPKAPEPQQVVEEVVAAVAVKQKERAYVKFDSLNEQIADLFNNSEFPEEHIPKPVLKQKKRVQVRNNSFNSQLMEGAARAISHTVKNQPKYEAKPLREQQSVEDRIKLLEQDIFRVQAQATPNTLVAGIGASLDSGGGSVNLWDLDDVNIGAPLDGKYPTIEDGAPLVYDATAQKWVAGGVGVGGASGVSKIVAGLGIDVTPANGVGIVELDLDAALTDLRDVNGTPFDGALLVYNTDHWDVGSLNTSQLALNNPQGNPFSTGLKQYSRSSIIATDIYTTQEDANILFVDLINDLDDRINELEPDPTDPNASSIGDLDDVSLAGADTGDFLVYDASTSMWNAATVDIPNSTVGTILSDSGNEKAGDIFFKTDDEELYIYTTEWTKVSGSGGASVKISPSAPTDPSLGDLWVETDQWSLYTYDGYNWIGLTNDGLLGTDSVAQLKSNLYTAVDTSTDYDSLKAALLTALS